MARKHRIETTDGFYHLINRGNFKRDLFAEESVRAAFVKVLGEAVERSSWELLSYVVMRNHFHLLIHTPRGNLISGMQWLQSTFANRHNRFHQVQGHLFQGRYKSLIVEPGDALGAVADYIHLNPARAGIVDIDHLPDYKWSSLYYLSKRKRPAYLSLKRFLEKDLGLNDNRPGHNLYLDRLKTRMEMTPDKQKRWKRDVCRGWCVGSKDFQKGLIKAFVGRDRAVHFEGIELKEANEMYWELFLEKGLKRVGVSAKDLDVLKKSDIRKIVLADWLKQNTSAPNAWLARNLKMGHPASLSSLVSRHRKQPSKTGRASAIKLKILNIAG